MSEELQLPDVQEVNFERSELDDLYLTHQLNPARIEQIEREVIFADLVEDLTGRYGSEINCPFHGTDRTPSFYIYPPARGNNGWCFGCAPGYQYWSHVRFVRELLGYSFPKAVQWIEKQYNLPFIPDEVEEEVDDAGEVEITIEYEDLIEPFILKAKREILANKDFEQAQEFLRIFFQAEASFEAANALAKDTDITAEERCEEVSRMKTQAAVKLARVLGHDAMDEVASRK